MQIYERPNDRSKVGILAIAPSNDQRGDCHESLNPPKFVHVLTHEGIQRGEKTFNNQLDIRSKQ